MCITLWVQDMTPPAAPFGEVDALYEKATKGEIKGD